jgi:hypothetical protein
MLIDGTVQPKPFPHVVCDGLFEQEWLEDVAAEFPPVDDRCWSRFDNDRERKSACAMVSAMGPRTRELLQVLCSPEWCEALGDLFGVPEMTADLYGGGMHMIMTGGMLDVHVDFNRHHNLNRRVNQLLYLNDGYEDAYGGQLMLGKHREVSIAPVMNRLCAFATSETSWHGHPHPWRGRQPRKSIAVYYYSPEPAEDARDHSTIFAA